MTPGSMDTFLPKISSPDFFAKILLWETMKGVAPPGPENLLYVDAVWMTYLWAFH